jgi:hypothetical protein
MKEDAMGFEEKSAEHKTSTSNMEVDAKTQQEVYLSLNKICNMTITQASVLGTTIKIPVPILIFRKYTLRFPFPEIKKN